MGSFWSANGVIPQGHGKCPQGGIDDGETIEQASRRECFEEIGVPDFDLIAITDHWLLYDLPDELRRRIWGGRFKGQKQKWVLGKFSGDDSQIDLEQHGPPEFSAWKWVTPATLLDLVVPFKRDTYRAVLQEFHPWLQTWLFYLVQTTIVNDRPSYYFGLGEVSFLFVDAQTY